MMPNRPPQHRPRFTAPPQSHASVRGSASARGYDHAWQKVRAQILSAHPVCCFMDHPDHKHECEGFATVVDHITPLPEGDRLEPSNLRPVCRTAHQRLTQNLVANGVNELPKLRMIQTRTDIMTDATKRLGEGRGRVETF